MKVFTLTEIHRRPGELLEMAAHQPVALSRHGRIRFVLMSADHHESLTGGGAQAEAAGVPSRAAARRPARKETQPELVFK